MKLSAPRPTSWYAPAIDTSAGPNRITRELLVCLSPMTAADFEAAKLAELGRLDLDPATSDNSGRGADVAWFAALRDRVVAACVTSVQGLEEELSDGTTAPVTDGAGLVRVCRASSNLDAIGILDDIFAALRDRSRLSEGLARESPPPRALSPPPPPSIMASGAADAVGPNPSPPAHRSLSADGKGTATA